MEQRLIDANKLNFDKLYQYFETDNDYDYACGRVEDADTVFTIPDNPTNGDMIKALYPNGIYDKQQNVFEHEEFTIVILSDDWWNAPYNADRR